MNRNLLQPDVIAANVRAALAEDVGTGDLSAQLVPAAQTARARVITRERAIVCGQAWVNEVFRQLDPEVVVTWHCADGETVEANQTLFELAGPRALPADRGALGAEFPAAALGHRDPLPPLRGPDRGPAGASCWTPARPSPACASRRNTPCSCGGCHNHRIGLYDAFLIKENHIAACGSITAAIRTAREQAPGKPVEVEVENMTQLAEALEARADSVMLDNFDLQQMREAVAFTAGRTVLEASGGVNESTLRAIAETGVDYISIGTLTKDCKAIDLSMRML